MSNNLISFKERLNLFNFNYETYKLAYSNNRYNLCKRLFNEEMLYFLDNTSYELMDSILMRINLFQDLKLSKKTLYSSFNKISAKPLLNYLYNISQSKKLTESKSMPSLISFTSQKDTCSISSSDISDNKEQCDILSKSIIYNKDDNSISSDDISDNKEQANILSKSILDNKEQYNDDENSISSGDILDLDDNEEAIEFELENTNGKSFFNILFGRNFGF